MKPIDPRLVRRSAAVRRYLLASVMLGTVTAVLIVAQAWLVATVVARGFAGMGVGRPLVHLMVATAGVFALRAGVGWLHEVAATRAAVQVKSQLRSELAAAIFDPRGVGSVPQTSRVVALFGDGLDALDAYFAKYLPQLVLAITVPAIVGIAVLWADPLSAVTIMVTLPLIVVFMILVGWLTQERTARRWAALTRLSHHFLDVLDGLVVLKIFGRSQEAGLRRVGEQHRRQSMAALKLAFLSSFVMELFAMLAVALVAVSVGLRVVEDRLDLRTAMFVLLLAPEAFLPLRRVGAHFHDSAEGAAAAQDAFAVLDGAARHGGTRMPPLRGEISLNAVTVTYPGRSEPALDRATATVRPGEFIALTGPSGSGKSTLLGVLLGFVAPSAGSVRIAGTDLAELDIAHWRQRIAWVPQVPGLIDGTVESNVRLGLDVASAAQVRRALADAGAASLALDRPVRESGLNLSAGERRRVGIARALLRARHGEVELLLLDEPTAGLDAEAELHVIETLRASGLTTIVVTHRSAIRDQADREISLATMVPA